MTQPNDRPPIVYSPDALVAALAALDQANAAAGAALRDLGLPSPSEYCRVYWGSHGCRLSPGHEGPHRCNDDCPTPDRYTIFGEDAPTGGR